MRVVFDTNVFSASSFEVLAASPMRQLCRASRIVPVYGHVFLEETLKAYGVNTARADLLRKWLPFIADTVDRFCTDFVGIWHRELVQGHGRRTNIFMRPREQARLLASFRTIPADGSWKGLVATQVERDVENGKRDKQRAISIQIRNEVAAVRRKHRGRAKRFERSLSQRAYERLFDLEGRTYLLPNLPCADPLGVWSRWTRSKMSYPYFTMFVTNMLFMQDFAANTQNRIDLNAQTDLDLMTHLLNAQVLVTNEAGFMREAFERLWRPQGKVLMNTEQFVSLLKKM